MHFYTQTDKGVEPRHYVPMASRPNELRPTRMSDVKAAAKRGEVWAPSVTTILAVLAKPALVDWKIDQHLRVASMLMSKVATAPECFHFDTDKFIEEVRRLTEIELDKAPSAGTDIHKELEAWFSNNPVSDSALQICKNVDMEIRRLVPLAGLTPERNFLHPMGFAGQCDLSGNGWVIDFKSKQEAAKFKPGKMAYQDHFMQLAAYRMGLDMPTARCANVFICLEDGQVDFHEHTEKQLQKGWEMFRCALDIWKLQHQEEA